MAFKPEQESNTNPENLFVLFSNSLEALTKGELKADELFLNRLIGYIRELRAMNPPNLETRLLEPLNQFRSQIPTNTFETLWHKISNPI